MKPPRPLHSRFTIAGAACFALFAAILIADSACRHFGWPRVERWPVVGTPLSFSPLPLLVGVFVCSITAAILRARSRARRAPFACAWCDYDRRGLATDAPCPECGRFPLPPPVA